MPRNPRLVFARTSPCSSILAYVLKLNRAYFKCLICWSFAFTHPSMHCATKSRYPDTSLAMSKDVNILAVEIDYVRFLQIYSRVFGITDGFRQ
jgi:hypothetical protein